MIKKAIPTIGRTNILIFMKNLVDRMAFDANRAIEMSMRIMTKCSQRFCARSEILSIHFLKTDSFLNLSCNIKKMMKKGSPFNHLSEDIFFPFCREGIIFPLSFRAFVFPGPLDQSFFLQFVQDGIEGAMIEFEMAFAFLLDFQGKLIAVFFPMKKSRKIS